MSDRLDARFGAPSWTRAVSMSLIARSRVTLPAMQAGMISPKRWWKLSSE